MRFYRYIGDENPDDQPTLSQNHVNSILKKEREKTETTLAQLQADLTTLSEQNQTLADTAKLTDEQSATFKAENEDMRQRGLSDSEKWTQERAEMTKKIKDLEVTGKAESDKWHGTYHNAVISQALKDACAPNETHNGATNPDHIVSLLANRTQVNDEDGSIFISDFEVPTEDGFEKKDVTPTEAVSVMSQNELHLNLFNKKGKAGSGDDSNTGGKGNPKISAADGPSDSGNLKDMKKWMSENVQR